MSNRIDNINVVYNKDNKQVEDMLMVMKGREIILGILQSGPHTGYEINDILQTRLSHFFDATSGMIYPTLKKLGTEKLVTKQQISQTDRPNKNIYTITKAGKTAFSKAMSEPTSDEILKSDVLMRLYLVKIYRPNGYQNFFRKKLNVRKPNWRRYKSSWQPGW